MTDDRRAPIAVSMGDPCGVGPDIILKAWRQNQTSDLNAPYFVVGSEDALQQRAQLLELEVALARTKPGEALKAGHLNVLDLGMPVSGKPGEANDDDARITIAAINESVRLVHQGLASALTTAPINKQVLYNVGFAFPGHTEFLGALCGQHWGGEHRPVMMLAGPSLRTIPVTIHVPICEVPIALTQELIEQTVRIANTDLKTRFGIENPRITLTGLNPHAGEQGTIGTDEVEKIEPAVQALRAEGIAVTGPLPADSIFHEEARAQSDVVVCMYHDQALIPAKMLAFHDAVNVTLGLPIIRTSPDHGTAYDIAGTGKANPASYIQALKMAHEMAAHS